MRASYRLSAESKLVWKIISEFDSSAGCWAGDATLAKRVGLPLDRFIALRDTLEGVDLLRVIRTGSRTIWFACLPGDFPQEAKLETLDKLLLAERLDRYLVENQRARLSSKTQESAEPSSKTHPAVMAPEELQAAESLTAVPVLKAVLEGTAVPSAEAPSKASPENGNGATRDGEPQAIGELIERIAACDSLPEDEAKAAASRKRWKEVLT